MAGDWIKMRKSLLADPRVVRIMSALRADRFRTIGGLFSAWCLFDEQTSDGTLTGYTPEIFDEIVGLPGLCEAMRCVGWLDVSPQGLIAVDFEKHNGATAKRRAQESVRKMSARTADKRPHSMQTKTGTREEKRREEKNTRTKTKTAASPSGVDAVLPDNLQTEEFGTSWRRWCQFRKELKAEMTATTVEILLRQMSDWGPARAIEAIDHTILKGWRGIKEPEAAERKQEAWT